MSRLSAKILRTQRAKQPSAPSPWRSRYLPLLERLEDRLTPATRTWDGGGANDLWSNAQNWDGDLTAPANGDVVIIPATPNSASVIFDGTAPAGVTLASLTSDEPFTLSGGTLTVSGILRQQNNTTFTLSGGTLAGATVQAAAGSGLVGTGNFALAGVTLDGSGAGDNPRPLDLTPNTLDVSVTGGLTLKGATLPLGNTAGNTRSRLLFIGPTPQVV